MVHDEAQPELGYHLIHPPWPAAPANLVWPANGVPDGWRVEILVVSYTYASSAVAGTRTHRLDVTRGASAFTAYHQQGTQAANITARYAWVQGGVTWPAPGAINTGGQAALGRLVLPRGYSITIAVGAIGAGDVLSNPLICYLARRTALSQ